MHSNDGSFESYLGAFNHQEVVGFAKNCYGKTEREGCKSYCYVTVMKKLINKIIKCRRLKKANAFVYKNTSG